ncbi:MAG: oligosaccharide flippase family protein [Actinomycetota bacterium]|nr:oligosaccharide flippase family protein [Actinomycetota bacterium]
MSEAEGVAEPGLTGAAARDVATVAKGGAVQIAGQITQRFLSMLFSILLGRMLGPPGLGMYGQVRQILTVCGQLGLAGYNYAAMRFIAIARANDQAPGVKGAARVALGGTLLASTIVFAALVIGAPLLAEPFEPDNDRAAELSRLLRLGAAYVPLFGVLQVLRYCTQAYKTMVPSVVAGNIVQPSVRFVLGVGALLLGFGVAGAVTTLAVSMAVGAVVAWILFARLMTEAQRHATPAADRRAMTRFALPQAGASLLGIQSLGLGVLLLGLISDRVAVAFFTVALALEAPGGIFLSGIVNIWAPVVSDLHAKGAIDRLGSLYQTITRWVATFSFPMFAALILEPDLFIEVTFGPRFLDAVPVVMVMAAGNFFYTGTGPTGYVISMTGHPGYNFVNSVVSVGLYIMLAILVVPSHGALGMAWVHAGITALANSSRVVIAHRLVGVQPFGRSFLKPVVATIVGAAVLLLWRAVPGDQIWIEIAGLTVAGIAYLATLKVMGIDEEERYVWERIKARTFGRRS